MKKSSNDTHPEPLSVPFPIGGTQPAASTPPRYPPSAPPVSLSPLVLVVVVVVVVVSLSSTLGLRAAGVASLRPFALRPVYNLAPTPRTWSW